LDDGQIWPNQKQNPVGPLGARNRSTLFDPEARLRMPPLRHGWAHAGQATKQPKSALDSEAMPQVVGMGPARVFDWHSSGYVILDKVNSGNEKGAAP
jgi:hypothetical protein